MEDREKELTRINRFHARILRLDFDIPAGLLYKFEKNNIESTVDLRNISDHKLEEIYKLTPKDIQEVRAAVHNPRLTDKMATDDSMDTDSGNVSVYKVEKVPAKPVNFFHPSLEEQWITTGSRRFDAELGGKGVAVGRITQVSGTAGAGKTQFCLKLCLNVQLPPEFGGLDGDALYLDSEDCFRPERILEMADAMVPKLLDKEKVLNRVHRFGHQASKIVNKVVSVYDLVENLNGRVLEDFLASHPAIRLFVIDSISYHFRYDYEGKEMQKVFQMANIGQRLKYLARKYDLAIVVTNQVKFTEEQPAMGELWNSIPSTSIKLKRTVIDDKFDREASLLRSLHCVRDGNDGRYGFKYKITKSGMEDM